MDIRLVFGRNLRRLRLKADLSQEALAALMGVDRAFISSMERGQQNVTLFTLREVAQALGCGSVDFLNETTAAEEERLPTAPASRRKRTKS